MSVALLEVAADALTLASAILTTRLRTSLYPVGIAATVLFFFVFWNARLYASAGLQVYFTVIQVYGWWFWRRGDHGRPPAIRDWSWLAVGALGLCAVAFTVVVAWVLDRFTNAQSPLADTTILALSVLAQFLLDRKQLKNWLVWGLADLLSIVVYGGQGLWLTAWLYALLLINVVVGFAAWRRAMIAEVSVMAGVLGSHT